MMVKCSYSRRISDTERQLLGLADLRLIREPNSALSDYLLYRRETIFVDEIAA